MMKYIEVVVCAESADNLRSLAKKVKAVDIRFTTAKDQDAMQVVRLLVEDDCLQETLDALQLVLGAQPTARITVLAVEVALPKAADTDKKAEENPQKIARESLYEEVSKGAKLDDNFFILLILSSIVAMIGLLENNVAVIVGAMVIAPLLGPNLALSLGAALGDTALLWRALRALLIGLVIPIAFAAGFAFFWSAPLDSVEILTRTSVNSATLLLALASGAAAALSLTSGVSGVLVGVMVAVALLPPAVVLGMMMGDGRWEQASSAALLLAINVVAVNFSSKIVFLYKGIRPRTWFEKAQANKAMAAYLWFWGILLVLLFALILLRTKTGIPLTA